MPGRRFSPSPPTRVSAIGRVLQEAKKDSEFISSAQVAPHRQQQLHARGSFTQLQQHHQQHQQVPPRVSLEPLKAVEPLEPVQPIEPASPDPFAPFTPLKYKKREERRRKRHGVKSIDQTDYSQADAVSNNEADAASQADEQHIRVAALNELQQWPPPPIPRSDTNFIDVPVLRKAFAVLEEERRAPALTMVGGMINDSEEEEELLSAVAPPEQYKDGYLTRWELKNLLLAQGVAEPDAERYSGGYWRLTLGDPQAGGTLTLEGFVAELKRMLVFQAIVALRKERGLRCSSRNSQYSQQSSLSQLSHLSQYSMRSTASTASVGLPLGADTTRHDLYRRLIPKLDAVTAAEETELLWTGIAKRARLEERLLDRVGTENLLEQHHKQQRHRRHRAGGNAKHRLRPLAAVLQPRHRGDDSRI